MKLRLPIQIKYDLSVIIVSYNTRAETMACVQSILDHKGKLNVEIIIVDNCSTDGSAAALREAFPEINVIDSPANGGFAYGNNIGLEHSHGEFVLMLNPDTIIIDGGLIGAIDYLKSHPEIGALGANISYPDGQPQNSLIRFLSLKTLFFLIFVPSNWAVHSPFMGDHRYGGVDADKITKVDSVMGSFMLMPRSIIETVGGLDHRFFMYGEECEFCHRITASGKQVVYYPEMKILHHSGASTQDQNIWRAIEMTRGHILFLRYTRGVFIAYIGMLMMLIRDLVRLPYYAVQTIFRGFRPSPAVAPWWGRLKFLIGSLWSLPSGQTIELPDPAKAE